MIHARLTRFLPACAAALALAVPAHAARALDDGTSADAWTLGNGLRVVVRNVPRADAVAVVVAYPAGRDDDPAGQEGLTALMAEVAFTAAAGEIPARTHADLESQRPVGWNVQVERRRTEFAELASPQQFPGVLHQVAERMRGVRVTDDDVTRARAALVERWRESYGTDPGAELYVTLGQRAAGWDQAAVRRWLDGEGIAAVRARDLSSRIAEAYVPARAVLSLTGDFEDMNLRAFVESEFGGIPAGTPRGSVMPDAATTAGADLVPHAGVERATGAAGVLAPALADTLHPSFYLTMLVLGGQANGLWNDPALPARSRFQYSILDDPDVVRFYPPSVTGDWTLDHLGIQMDGLVNAYRELSIEMEQVNRLRLAVEWLLGGPMPEPLAVRARTDRSVLYRLASAAATRELWGGEAFWSTYRLRFDPQRTAGADWSTFLRDPQHAYRLMFVPRAEVR